MSEMNTEIAALKIKKILKDNCFRRETNATSGKINFNRLALHKTTSAIFSRESERQGKKYHIELLVDASGSMEGSKINLATEAAEYFCKVIGKYCDLNLVLFNYLEKKVPWQEFRANVYRNLGNQAIYPKFIEATDKRGFSHIVPVSQAGQYEDFVDFVDTDEGHTINEQQGHPAAGNWELANILNSAQRLKQQKGHKIILVLLDGQPNLDYHSNSQTPPLHVAGRRVDKLDRSVYKEKITALAHEGVTVIAFGILTNEPQKYFPNFYSIKNTTEILPTLVKSLQTLVKI